MHLNLGRRPETLVCLKHIAVCVYFTDIFWSHETFADTGRSTQEFIVIELYGEVSVIRRNHAAVIYTFADLAHFFFDFKFVLHSFILQIYNHLQRK